MSCNLNSWKETCLCPVWQIAGSHHSLGWAVHSWANIAEAEVKGSLKEDVPLGPGAKEAKLLCAMCLGWCKTTPEAEELCHWEPTRAHASNSRTGAEGSGRSHHFKKVWKLVSKRQEWDYSTSCHNSRKEGPVQARSSLTLVCWGDAERI